MAFQPEVIEFSPTPEINFYSHGYTAEQVEEITEKRNKILSRNLREQPTTLEEYREIIIPWCRINRTEEFVLNAKKKKEVSDKPKRKKKEEITYEKIATPKV